MTKSLFCKGTDGSSKLLGLLTDDVRPEVTICPALVPLMAYAFREVEYDGYGQAVKFAGKRNEWLPRLWLHIRRIDNGQVTVTL